MASSLWSTGGVRRGSVKARGRRGIRRPSARLERLETRELLSGLLVSGAGPGSAPTVTVYDADTGAERFHFSAYAPGMTAGVRVAIGDINGDGSLDIVTAPGPGAAPVIKIFNSTNGSEIGQFEAPASWARGGVWIASGDVNGDGHADIVAAPGRGLPLVRVYEGTSGHLLESFQAAAGPGPHGWGSGAKVAVGDLNQDGHADIVAVSASGATHVDVYDGQTDRLVSSYTAFRGRIPGGASVAVGRLGSDRQLGVIVAARVPGTQSTAVKYYEGDSSANPSRFVVAHSAGRGGVGIAAVNLGGRGTDELALAPTRGPGHGLGAGASILSRTPLTYPATASIHPASQVAYRLPRAPHGSFLAGDNSVAVSTAAVAVGSIEPPLSQNLPIIQRLAYFDPNLKQFVPVQANDPRLAGKDVTVITHGWAPGYQGWVDYEATQKNHVLKWWETDPTQPGYDPSWNAMQNPPQQPDSPFLLHGETSSTVFGSTEVSATGLAQSILSRVNPVTGAPADPNAVVLAYSWIDDSATPDWNALITKIPEESWKSEALTTLNGERLASGLETVLGSSFTGKLQLVGHSHGSKVVSVAASALAQANMPPNEVTLLDSPEDDVTVVGDAANYNWYFLKDLNINRSSTSSTFVSNIISEFDIPYSGVTLANGQGANLGQIVDVNLTPDIYYTWDLSNRHSYSANWYSGSGQTSVTYGQKVGQYWSPLLPANAGSKSPIKGLSPYYQQNWGYFSQPTDQQYVLNGKAASPKTETITFDPLSTPAVSLTQVGTSIQTLPISMRAPLSGQSGIAFDYQFPTYQPGDRLIVMDGSDVAFVMDASLVGTQPAHATISLYGLPYQSHALTFILTSETSNTTSRVVVSNFQSFDQPLLS